MMGVPPLRSDGSGATSIPCFCNRWTIPVVRSTGATDPDERLAVDRKTYVFRAHGQAAALARQAGNEE
jgi:hypothetical protein